MQLSSRPITEDERALLRANAEKARRDRAAALTGREHVVMAVIFAVIGVVFGLVKSPSFIGFLLAGFGALLAAVAEVKRRQRVNAAAASPTPWDEPPGGWHIDEIAVRPTRVVRAIDDNGDGQLWLVFDEGEAECFFIAEEAFLAPSETLLADLCKTEVTFGRIAGGGAIVSTKTAGSTVPAHGASGTEGSVEADVEAGYVWSPPEQLPGNSTTVARQQLPLWMSGEPVAT